MTTRKHPTDALLTIAIPTFNRAATIDSCARDVAKIVAANDALGLIVDDGSTDGTGDALSVHHRGGLRVVLQPHNLGYAHTFCRILDECETEWVLISADDDTLHAEVVPVLVSWLEREQPGFVSTQWCSTDGTLYRGRSEVTQIKPSELRQTANHAPGLIYHVSSARQALPLLREQLARESPAAVVYPQVIIAAHLIACGRALWWPNRVVSEGLDSPSQLVDSAGRSYWDPQARLAQALAFDHIFTIMRTSSTSPDYRRACLRYQRRNELAIYPALRSVAGSIDPSVAEHTLDRAVFRHFVRAMSRSALGRLPGALSSLRRLRA